MAGSLHYYRDGMRGHGIELYNGNFSWSSSAQSIYAATGNLLETGPYLITIQITGAPYYSENWSGIMQWYNGSTNSNDATDIYMTGMGHAPNAHVIYARTRRFGGNNYSHALQVWHSGGSSSHTTRVYATKLSTQGW